MKSIYEEIRYCSRCNYAMSIIQIKSAKFPRCPVCQDHLLSGFYKRGDKTHSLLLAGKLTQSFKYKKPVPALPDPVPLYLPKSIKMKKVKSSNIRQVGYDSKTKKLFVSFRSGGMYEYDAIPQATFDGLEKAQSIGSYLHKTVFRKDLGIKYRKLSNESRQG